MRWWKMIPRAIVREIVHAARAASSLAAFIHAEDHRNLAAMVEDPAEGGWGVDAVWADDFHHVMRRLLPATNTRTTRTTREPPPSWPGRFGQGWLFTGQPSVHLGTNRGTIRRGSRCDALSSAFRTTTRIARREPRDGRPAARQHLARRLPRRERRPAHGTDDAAALHGMRSGQAGDTVPVPHRSEPGLGHLVTEGRRRESRASRVLERGCARPIPDPQSPATHADSHLEWSSAWPAHAAVLALYRALLALRLDQPALGGSDLTSGDAEAPDEGSIVIRRAEQGKCSGSWRD